MTSKYPTNRDRSPIVSPMSRRALLGTLSLTPVAVPTVAGTAISTSPNATVADRQFGWADEPAVLRRTRAGRGLSRARYHNAEQFFTGIEEGAIGAGPNLLYHAGIVLQLGLSAHLIDVGLIVSREVV